MAAETFHENQTVLGYVLKEHIGDGGFGEVWAAEAPGGLMKAIKFIYGYHDQSRAQRELKSLNHVKALRHPFLLSLDRIDVVGGRMVVVTELADHSLLDRFEECTSEGMPGVPRRELLMYMREAADALDFIGGTHSLQHLDIKPENLLLVSGHVKIADFGLVKDVQDCTQSIMGGLTPAYAPPELFDGRPNTMSDQYSLAVVYQEMLTGERPFAGNTPAQLAAQHIHGRPNLRPLPRSDQATVSRALSKDPKHRYPSCVAFIDELIGGQRHEPAKQRPQRVRRRPRPAAGNHSPTVRLSGLENSTTARVATKLPPLKFDPAQAEAQPVLIIGMGSVGTRVVQRVKKRFLDCLGPLSRVPAFHFLALDVDKDALYPASQGDSTSTFSASELLELPLRRPEQYRDDKSLDLSWMSRRWIYNIPRSLNTEGIRPLGRLAVVDNDRKIQDCLHALANQLGDPKKVRITAENLGMKFQLVPRVYLVGAASGGIVSGGALDLAYRIRDVFHREGHETVDLIGLLVHGVGQSNSNRSLAAANSYALLRELQHFRKNGYPGDTAFGIEPSDEPPFDSTYFLHAGANQDDAQFSDCLRGIADYIVQDTTSSFNAVNRVARQSDDPQGDEIRTFAVANLGFSVESALQELQNRLAKQVLQRWCEYPRSGVDFDAAVRKLQADAQLSHESQLRAAQTAVSELTGLDPNDLASEVARNVARTDCRANGGVEARREMDSSVRGWFHTELVGRDGHTVADRAERSLRQLASSKGKQLESLMATLADQPGGRLGDCMGTVDAVLTYLAKTRDQLDQVLVERQAELEVLSQTWTVECTGEEIPVTILPDEWCRRYCNGTAQHEIAQLAIRYAGDLIAEVQRVQTLIGSLMSATESCVNASDSTDRPSELAVEDNLAIQSESFVVGEVHSMISTLVDEMDRRLQVNCFDGEFGFWGMLAGQDARRMRALSAEIHSTARLVVSERVAAIRTDDLISSLRMTNEELNEWMRPFVDNAMPNLMDCGGEARLFLLVPRANSSELCLATAEAIFEEAPTVVPSTSVGVTFCCEAHRLPLTSVAMRLIEDEPDASVIVGRIESRADVRWDPLSSAH